MEKTQTGIAHDSESSSTISCIDRINIELSKKISIDTTDNELSKEREEELLFGAEEEGDDEDVLSDDSLRLRLSDDEDVEQEDNITNSTNISEFKLQNRQSEYVDVITEKNLCSDIQQIVEEVYKPDDGKLEQKNNSAIKTSQNSALFLDDTSENKRIQDNICNSENSSVTVSASTEKCTSKSNKDLEITAASVECSNAASEQHIALGNDNLSTKNRIQINNLQNAEPVIHSNDNLKETISDNKETNATNTCELNKLDNVDSNSPIIDSAKVQVYKSEKLSTLAIVANSDDNNLSEKVVDKIFNDDNHSVKCPFVEINNSQDPKDSIKSDNLSFHKDYVEHVSKTSEHKDIIQSKDTSKIQPVKKESSTLLVQDQNNLLSIKDSKEITNEDRDINKSVMQIINNNSTSTLQRILLESIDVKNSDNEIKSINATRRKRSKKTINTIEVCVEEDKQEKKENGRQKRRTARNAEEIIRKKCLNSDSDSSDSSTEQFVPVNHKLNQDIRSASPPSLKRNCSDNEIFNSIKKVKMSIKSEEKNDITKLAFVEKFFQRDMKEKLPKLTQEELEELLIQKIAETITMRSEIGQLREQARISEKYQEVMRTKLQQLTKQVKDFEMVVNRNTIDRRTNPDKPVAPIKINRSVGLQVNFITEHGIQSLRQVQQTSHVKPVNAPSNVGSSPAESNNNNNNATRRNGIKTRSPRPAMTTSTPTVPQSPIQTAPLISTVTPAALVVAKPLDSTHTLTLSSQPPGLQPILPAPQQQIQTHPQQAIVLNGKIQNQVNRPTVITSKPKNNDLIDLTDEEEKNKSANVKVTAITTTSILEQQLNTPKYTQSFQRVIQTIPTNVVPITQPAIKVITPNQPPATALVNNMNPPRVAYVMQSSTGSPRQVLITSNANQQVQIRPVTTCRPSFSTVTYKTGMSTIANGTVRVLTTPVLSNISKHPAPLPDTPSYTMTPGWKLPPPAPSLKISKVSNGIVLSWNMNLSDKYADIASYQLYAYQEVAGVNPNTSLWKKVGDVRALPLPMACTLTQFSEGNNYYFAVRAVDTHSRKGQYSIPGNISL
ncbi:Activating transcription factor 7-interacting protein 1 [Camponotus japonicus]